MEENNQLPAEFSDLQALADRLAVGDDSERQSITDAASPEELRNLVDTVSPRFDAINAYLDEHDDDSAHLLGSLAEAAAEVAVEIGPSAN